VRKREELPIVVEIEYVPPRDEAHARELAAEIFRCRDRAVEALMKDGTKKGLRTRDEGLGSSNGRPICANGDGG